MKGIFRRMSISNSFAVCIGFQIATNVEALAMWRHSVLRLTQTNAE